MNSPQTGDRVRLTCGKSVMEGTVTAAPPTRLYVAIDGDVTRAFDNDRWAAEILPPPLPKGLGTIVRDGAGVAWQFDGACWRRAGSSHAWTAEEIQATFGPTTVVWKPTVFGSC